MQDLLTALTVASAGMYLVYGIILRPMRRRRRPHVPASALVRFRRR